MEKLEPLYIVCKKVNGIANLENSLAVFEKVQHKKSSSLVIGIEVKTQREIKSVSSQRLLCEYS